MVPLLHLLVWGVIFLFLAFPAFFAKPQMIPIISGTLALPPGDTPGEISVSVMPRMQIPAKGTGFLRDPFLLADACSKTCYLAAVFYLNYLLLMPKLWMRRKWWQFSFFALLIMISVIAADIAFLWRGTPVFRGAGGADVIFHPLLAVSPGLLVLVISAFISGSGLYLIAESYRQEQRTAAIAREQLSSELGFLRHQLSPHYFFNTLNTIRYFVHADARKADQTLILLSDQMRYMLYEGDLPLVSLEKEISFIEDYVTLQRMRLPRASSISLETDYRDGNLELPPFLFLPFIENAFKHGASAKTESTIAIRLEAAAGRIRFSCTNRIPDSPRDRGGIGLRNIRRRLELLFPNRHRLEITQDAGNYNVLLIIMPDAKSHSN